MVIWDGQREETDLRADPGFVSDDNNLLAAVRPGFFCAAVSIQVVCGDAGFSKVKVRCMAG